MTNTRLEIQSRYWRDWVTNAGWGYWHPVRPNLHYHYEEDNLAPVLEKMKARIKKITAKDEPYDLRRQYRIVKITEIKIVEEI